MGSEGYLLNQFLCARTNLRTDRWGGSIENRMRLPVEIVARIRAAVGDDFIIMYRHSLLDLVEGGNTWEEVVAVAKALEQAGVTILNTGYRLARGARADHRHLGAARGVCQRGRAPAARSRGFRWWPRTASTCRSRPNDIIARGDADMVSMARPFLADPVLRGQGRAAAAPTKSTPASAATRPASTTPSRTSAPAAWSIRAPATRRSWCMRRRRAARKVAVVGAGPAGLSAATVAAECGHDVTLFDSQRQHRRPVQDRDADPGQGRIRRDDPLLRAASSN